jgi:AcrR family transcriptional regulator
MKPKYVSSGQNSEGEAAPRDRRGLTQDRICKAARELFFIQGYTNTTIEQIAAAAGTYRSTLYTNFKNKEEILAVIVKDYTVALVEVASRLPGPAPTRRQIDRWVTEAAIFVAEERIPTVVMTDLGNSAELPEPLQELGAMLLQTLAARLPAFGRAVTPGPEQPLAFARAILVLRNIAWACLQFSRDESRDFGRGLLTAAAEALEVFIDSKT